VNGHTNEVDDLHISCDGKQVACIFIFMSPSVCIDDMSLRRVFVCGFYFDSF